MSYIIFQSVTGETKEFKDLNLLQVALRDQLRDKLFLLVLDDVWSESSGDWESLVAPLSACAPGSKIIITTRKEKLLRELGCDKLDHLQSLSHDDAVCLFAKHALGENNLDSHPRLKAPGEGIVRKCNGLPLALIALGKLLRGKEDEVKWKEIEDSDIWCLEKGDEIIPALRLSYHELPADLKQLFAYCSLFPKDYAFKKDDLVLLWTAKGFLHQVRLSKSTVEHLGHECFDELLSRLEKEMGKNVRKQALGTCRHMSFVCETYGPYKKFEGIEGAKGLKTLLSIGVKNRWESNYLSNKVLVDLLPELQFLRVLSLSGYEISEVPDSIGKLKHLRYLNLSKTKITHLPENVCDLYNLETLILFGCSLLTKLPNNFIKLKSLRHLDIRDTPKLKDMPVGVARLKSLQTLSKIIIGGESDFSITQVKDLENLCGKVSIEGLEKVKNAKEAREANLSQKRLTELEVEWSDASRITPMETTEDAILDALKPYNDCLEKLGIVNYLGLQFPEWVGDSSFRQLARVSIRGCKKCTSLPPFGQLESLKELSIQDMGDVKVVGSEFFGTGLAFPSLESLKLKIKDCPNLGEVSIKAPLLSLRGLRITEFGVGLMRSLVHVAPSVTKLVIWNILGLTDEVWRGVILDLKAVEDLTVMECDEIRYLWESKEAEASSSQVLVNLRNLYVRECKNMLSLGEKDEEEYNYGSNLLTSLSSLEIYFCKNFKHLSCPNNIETLTISGCNSMACVSFSKGGQKLKSVYIYDFKKVLLKEELGGEKNVLLINPKTMPLLQHVDIYHYPNLASIIELGDNFIHLTTLIICKCKSTADLQLQSPSMDIPGLWPPNLRVLEIGMLKKPISEWGPQEFPSKLVNLTLYGEREEATQLSHLHLPSSLTRLKIWNFEKLESFLEGLQHLTSLQHLQIGSCPKMKELPQTLLPSLLSLVIYECRDLKERCSKGGGFY
ncbi:NB-ARC domains-containing protein [Tanacetum coccineum]